MIKPGFIVTGVKPGSLQSVEASSIIPKAGWAWSGCQGRMNQADRKPDLRHL
jgi:hypothetical protein